MNTRKLKFVNGIPIIDLQASSPKCGGLEELVTEDSVGDNFFKIVYAKDIFPENGKKLIKKIELADDFRR
ncbi:hypothetical protein CLV31_1148 [Algoriphagus aquaeductus]|uniref:Uncharacterized protein n=1 Tax=Algoriphagus aquaeductus TaxID=475299 RepID=A0A326RQ46_9BACT|nr:hypothetical protein CLV31_1148 [Algoriphagus aquaeductus]